MHLLLLSFRFTPSSSLRTPQAVLISSNHTQPGPLGLIPSHPMLQPEPWSEGMPMASGMWRPSEVMWPSHDIYAFVCEWQNNNIIVVASALSHTRVGPCSSQIRWEEERRRLERLTVCNGPM